MLHIRLAENMERMERSGCMSVMLHTDARNTEHGLESIEFVMALTR